MKKFMMMMVMAVCCLTASAQGKYAIGAEAGYASFQNSYSPTKFGAKFQVAFDENWRGELAGNMFTKKDDVGLWDANINVHYVFNVSISILLVVLPLLVPLVLKTWKAKMTTR